MYGDLARNWKDSTTPMFIFSFFLLGCSACTLQPPPASATRAQHMVSIRKAQPRTRQKYFTKGKCRHYNYGCSANADLCGLHRIVTNC